MTTVRELHDRATELAQIALVARQEGRVEEATGLARQALEYETRAARLIPDEESSEPTRSILYLSAASLAYQSKDLRAAQRLVAEGLSGYPPPKVEQDLKDLLAQIDFEHHLEAQGVILEDYDLQIALLGRAVGSGMVIYQEFKKVIENTISLIHRTVEHRMGREFRSGPGRPSDIYRPFIPALSAGRHGSFAVTLRLGVDEDQQTSFLMSAPQVIEEILSGIEAINSSNVGALGEIINDSVKDAELYRRDFISLTRDMAPDGDKITFIGFTSKDRSVSLTRLQSDIEYTPKIESTSRQVELTPVTITGVLDHAIRREQKGIDRRFIEVSSEEGKVDRIIVGEGMIDVVRSYFGQMVEVKGTSVVDDKGDVSIHLRDIRAAGM
ncbi:hypothetical protein GF348_24390 [candidate division KSB3 bacterium]|nr:hypothetical protein [candidate division KSB3 bacterium]